MVVPTLDPPTASEDARDTAPSRREGDRLDESKMVFRQSMRERQVQASNSLEENREDLDSQKNRASTGWLINMFNSLEKQQETEKKTWLKNIKSEKVKKATYKNQLKSAYEEKLGWLEKQLETAETGQCCTADNGIHSMNIPAIHRVCTGTTDGSSSSSDEEADRRLHWRVATPKRGQESYEVTLQNSSPVKRAQVLEKTLRETVEAHARERDQWVKTLENAAVVTENGERLSAQQEQALLELRSELSIEQRKQRKKWKEQTQVLKEILQLTEEQLHSERKNFEEEIKDLENKLEDAFTEKSRIEAEALRTTSEKNELAAAQGKWRREKEAFESSIAQLQASQVELTKANEKLLQQLQETSNETSKSENKCIITEGPVKSDWEGKLDNAIMERNLAQQEAKQARSRHEEDRHKWKLKLEEAIQVERNKAKEEMDKSQQTWTRKLSKIEKEREEVHATLRSEREQWSTKLQKKALEWEQEARDKLQELQERHSLELRQLSTSDNDLMQRYTDAVENRNEIVFRLRRMEQQRSEEKCNWKLQLEGALADARRSAEQVTDLQKELEETRVKHTHEVEELQKKLEAEKNEYMQLHNSEDSRVMMEKIECVQEKAECQVAVMKENHAKQVKKLMDSLEAMQYKNVNLEAELKQLKDTSSKLKKETKKQKMALERSATELALTNKKHANEVEAWSSQLEEAKAEVRVLTDRCTDIGSRLHDVENGPEKQKLNAKYEESRATAETLSMKTIELEKKLQTASEARERVGKEALELASRLDDARAEMKDLVSKFEESKAEVRVLAGQLKEAKEENLNVTKEADDWKAKAGLLSDTVASLEKRLHDADGTEWAGQLADARREVEFTVSKMHELEERLKFAEEKETKHSSEICEWATQLDEAKEDYRVLRGKMNELEMRLEDEEGAKFLHEGDAHEIATQLKEKKAEIRVLEDEVVDLKKRAQESKRREMKQRDEIKNWKGQLMNSQAEVLELADRAEDLANRLTSLQDHHEQCKERWESHLRNMKSEREQDDKLEKESFDLDRDIIVETISSENNPKTVLRAVEEVRKDIAGFREAIKSTAQAGKAAEETTFGLLRKDIGKIQSNLEEVLAKLTLETEAMYETRNAVKTLKDNPTALAATDSSRFIESQQKLFSQVSDLRNSLNKLIEGNRGTSSATSVDLDVVALLRKKEIALAKSNAELETLKDQLIEEEAKREQAEAEVLLLNDQADAYTEELMTLQSENTRLEATLNEAECKMTEVLVGRQCPVDDLEQEVVNCESASTHQSDDDSTPLLEEALALAQGLTDIFHGKNEKGKEHSVMDILQNMSDMMDEHSGAGSDCSEAAKQPQPADADTREGSVNPIDESRVRAAQEDESKAIHVVVEQLYTRCQLLERERLEMMETTLDLLETTRSSSKEDVEKALTIARKRTAEDLIRVRQQNNQDRERLYHKACSHDKQNNGGK